MTTPHEGDPNGPYHYVPTCRCYICSSQHPTGGNKAPCQSCGHPTAQRCTFCGRALCQAHAAWSRTMQGHDNGAHPCPRISVSEHLTRRP